MVNYNSIRHDNDHDESKKKKEKKKKYIRLLMIPVKLLFLALVVGLAFYLSNLYNPFFHSELLKGSTTTTSTTRTQTTDDGDGAVVVEIETIPMTPVVHVPVVTESVVNNNLLRSNTNTKNMSRCGFLDLGCTCTGKENCTYGNFGKRCDISTCGQGCCKGRPGRVPL